MKPDTRTAMRELIRQVRDALPLEAAADACADECQGCSVKLIEYISSELGTWEQRLDDGYTPHFGDLSQLARSARNIHAALRKNGLVKG